MRSAICISVRMKSTRLPRKALLKIQGRSVIELLIDRLKLAKLPNMIVLCTSTHPDDAVLAEIAQDNQIQYFRGSEDDKLARFLEVGKKYALDYILGVDGDDLFCDPEIIDFMAGAINLDHYDYVTVADLPVGVSPNGIKVEALKRLFKTKTDVDTEVYGPFFRNGDYRVGTLKVANRLLKHPEYRMTLDYPEDYLFFQAVYKELGSDSRFFSLEEIMDLLKRKPEIALINRDAQEKYLLNLLHLQTVKEVTHE